MYDGHGTDAVNSTGALKNSITAVKDKMVTLGVLLDVGRHKGKQWLTSTNRCRAMIWRHAPPSRT